MVRDPVPYIGDTGYARGIDTVLAPPEPLTHACKISDSYAHELRALVYTAAEATTNVDTLLQETGDFKVFDRAVYPDRIDFAGAQGKIKDSYRSSQ